MSYSCFFFFLLSFLSPPFVNHTRSKILFNEYHSITVYGNLQIVRIKCYNIHGLHRAFATIIQLINYKNNNYWITESHIEDEPAVIRMLFSPAQNTSGL